MPADEEVLLEIVASHKHELDEAKRAAKEAEDRANDSGIMLDNAILRAQRSGMLSLASLLSLSRFMSDGSLMFSAQMHDALKRAAPKYVSAIKAGVTGLTVEMTWRDDVDVDSLTGLIEATREYRMYDQYRADVMLVDVEGQDAFYRWRMADDRSIFDVDRCDSGTVVERNIFDGKAEPRTLAEHVIATWTAEHRRTKIDESSERAVESANALLAALADLPNRDEWPPEVVDAITTIASKENA